MRLTSLPTAILAAAALAVPLFAQQAAHPAAASKTLRIGDMTKIAKQHVLKKQPEVPVRASDFKQSNARPKEWAYFEVEYETAKATAPGPKWVDDLAVTFYVILKGVDDMGKPEFNFFKETVHYRDVAKGQKHKAAMVLSPVALERFGMPFAFAVEMTDGEGDPISKSTSADGTVPSDWWTNERVAEKLVPREGSLVDRSKTIFQFVNPDDYEAVK